MSDRFGLEYIRVDANGLSFNVAVAGPSDSPRLAILMHGFPESSIAFRKQVPVFTELGYRVWSPDLRGYGGTSKPEGVDAYRMSALVADVAALIDVSGAKSVTLVGHDWGAAIAWMVAAEQVRPLERLIVINAPHPRCLYEGLRSPGQIARFWYALLFQLPWLPERVLAAFGAAGVARMMLGSASDRGRIDPEHLEVYRANALQPRALTGMLNYYRAAARSRGRPASGATQKIRVPTLFLWGENDVALRKELTFGTHPFVENLTLRYLPGVSHWVMHEAPETINRMIRAFLTGQPVPEA